MTRKHNKLSVRPHLDIVVTTTIKRGIAIEIKNGGLGPAIILCIEFNVGDKTYQIKSFSDYQEVFRGLINSAQVNSLFNTCCYMPDKHSVIASDSSIEIFSLPPTPDFAPLLAAFPQFGRTVSVNVEYKDMYNDKYKINRLSLTGGTPAIEA